MTGISELKQDLYDMERGAHLCGELLSPPPVPPFGLQLSSECEVKTNLLIKL